MRLHRKKIMVLLAAGGVSVLFGGCRTEVMAAREELAPATRDYISEYEGKEEDLAALNQRRREAGKPPFGIPAEKKAAAAEKVSAGTFEPMETINPAELPKNAPKTSSSAGGTVVVAPGDNLTRIAARNHTTVAKLAAANNLNPAAKLYVGQKLVIPGTAAAAAAAKTRKTPAAAPARTATGSAEVVDGLYTVKPGDSIDRIARRLGVKSADLLAANQLTSSSILRVGQKLVVPGGSAAAAAKAAQPQGKSPAAPAAEKSNPDDTLNNLIKDLGGTEEKSEAPAAPAAPAAEDNLATMEFFHDTKASDFAAKFDYSLDQLKAVNRDNWPADGVFKAGTLIRLPQ